MEDTAWELANGLGEACEKAGVPWIELVEDYVETVLETAVDTGYLPDPVLILPTNSGAGPDRWPRITSLRVAPRHAPYRMMTETAGIA